MTQEKLTIHGRAAARMAAVQALYQLEMEPNTPVEIVISQFITHRFIQQDELVRYIKPDTDWFRTLVLGVQTSKEYLDEAIGKTLSDDWRFDRLETVLRTILRLGAYEICKEAEVPAPVVINEYVSITKAFFDQKEPSFVNASLDKIARTREVSNP